MVNWTNNERIILENLDFHVNDYDAHINEAEGILFIKKTFDNKVSAVIENQYGESLITFAGTFDDMLIFFGYEV